MFNNQWKAHCWKACVVRNKTILIIPLIYLYCKIQTFNKHCIHNLCLKQDNVKFPFQNDCPAAKTYWPVILHYCDIIMTHSTIKQHSNRQQEAYLVLVGIKCLLSQYISSFKLRYRQQVKIIPTIWNRQKR